MAAMPSPTPAAGPTSPPSRARLLWPLLPVAATLVALRGVFTSTEIFFVRDLSLAFWPLHLWARRVLASDGSVFWDPAVAYGQSAIADPLRHILFPPVLLTRLLLPEIPGFNLSVALPFPIAALGAYVLLKRRASAGAAALGATLFALSGALLSAGSSPNMSWSAALMPFVLWAVDRLAAGFTASRFVAAATLFALQALAGEPVSLVSTAGVALALVAVHDGTWRERSLAGVRTLAAGATGALLAAPLLVPLGAAALGSVRATGSHNPPGFWSLHPLAALELFLPAAFGDYFAPDSVLSPWIQGLNSGRYPLLMSPYVGLTAIVLGAAASASREQRRWTSFWLVVLGIALVCALGAHTPVYPFLESTVPLLGLLRYPAKYLFVVSLALAALAAHGADALGGPSTRRAATTAICVAAVAALASSTVVVVARLAPDVASRALAAIANLVSIAPEPAVEVGLSTMPAAALRALAVGGATGALVWLAARGRHQHALIGLVVLAAADLLGANARLNPTLDADLFREPAWVATVREAGAGRVAVLTGGWSIASRDTDGSLILGYVPPDGISRGRALLRLAPGTSVIEASALVGWRSVRQPSAWGIRQSLSSDLAQVWPAEYEAATQAVASSDAASRYRYLARAGTRFVVAPQQPPGARPLGPADELEPLSLYELPESLPRAFVVAAAVVQPNLEAHTGELMSARFDPSVLTLVDAEPPTAGAAGAPEPAGAEIVRDCDTEVEVHAHVPEDGGYLVLLDSYAPDWVAEVDGMPSRVVRANGLFRAVRLAPGKHVVRFRYGPRSFYSGVTISALAALGALALVGREISARRARPATLTP